MFLKNEKESGYEYTNDNWDNAHWVDAYDDVRIRTIAFNNHVYYHKMINGETIEIKQLD